MQNKVILFLILFLEVITIKNNVCTDNPNAQRNPFCFPEDAVTVEKKEDVQKLDVTKEEQLQMIKTETKWQVKTVLPSSVIVQHKDDGQIREIALTSTNLCS